MKNIGRLVYRAIRSSNSNNILLSKPYKSNGSVRGLCVYLVSHRPPFTSSSRNQLDLASLNSSLRPFQWNHFQGQRRTMFIQTQSTPNPSSLMFYPGKPVMEAGSADFPNARSAMNSPLAKALFGMDGFEL